MGIGFDWDGWTVIIGQRSSKSTFGDNKIHMQSDDVNCVRKESRDPERGFVFVTNLCVRIVSANIDSCLSVSSI